MIILKRGEVSSLMAFAGRAAVRSVLLGTVLGSTQAATAAPADRSSEVLLEKRHPTRVSWAEVEVAEASAIKVWKGEHEREFTRGLSLNFVGRTRTEEVEDLLSGSGKSRSDIAPLASLLIAGKFDEGDTAWIGFHDALIEAVRALGPDSFNDFLTNFREVAHGALAPPGDFRMLFCRGTPGESELATLVFVKSGGGERGGREAGSTTFTGSSKEECGALHAALDGQPVREVITTGLSIAEEADEVLTVKGVAHTGYPAASLPAGAQFSRERPPENAGYFSRTFEEGSTHRYEEMRLPVEGGSGDQLAIHLLRTGAAPGAIPRDVVSSRSILVRWEWALRVRRFGLDPKGLEERHGELLQGIFLTAAHDTPDFEGFRHVVADSLNQLDRPITSAVLAEKFAEHNIKLRVEDVFTVLCTVGEQGADVAQYCLLKACAEVTNPREICSAIRGGLED